MSPLIAHSGVAALDLKMATFTNAIPPTYLGQGVGQEAIYQDSDGIVYVIQPGSSVATRRGFIIHHPGPAFSTATISVPRVSGPPANALVAPELPIEKREMPVVGYRGWKWTSKFRLGIGTRGFLGSTGVGGGWTNARQSAICQSSNPYLAATPHGAPEQNCGCGLYVIANLDELETHFSITDEMIVGAVVGWGKVIQHGREGWRAEHCRILALLDCKYSEAQLKNTRQAAKEYSLPLLERDGLERYVAEWGDPFADG